MSLDPVEYETNRHLLKIDEEVRRRDEADKAFDMKFDEINVVFPGIDFEPCRESWVEEYIENAFN